MKNSVLASGQNTISAINHATFINFKIIDDGEKENRNRGS